MQPFKRGDIVRQPRPGIFKYDYFHVDQAHENGGLAVIGDADGRKYGLSADLSELATLKDLVTDREARQRADQARRGGK